MTMALSFRKTLKKPAGNSLSLSGIQESEHQKTTQCLSVFNRTLQEEFVEMIDIGLEDVEEFNQRLTEWLIEYNSIRLTKLLIIQTPLGYINSQLLPMSSSRTGYCLFLPSVI